MSENRNLFRLTRFILLTVPFVFRFLALFKPVKNRVLIVKTDAIGDYILFRDFIEAVKKSTRFADYEIDLLGNELWRELALQYDSQYISRFYFVRADKLYYKPAEVFGLACKLFKRNYHTVLNPSSTRTFMTDGLSGLAAAKHTVGFESNTEGIQLKYKRKTDRFYSLKLKLPATVHFEFHRNRYYFESVLNESLLIKKPFINIVPKTVGGILIFPGAGLKQRGWEPEKFARLINLLSGITNQPIYVAGGPNEKANNKYICEQANTPNLINITGDTALTELVQRISSSALVIANDSSAVHVAVAVNTPSVCIAGGGHFTRFVPYPDDIGIGPLCVYEKMECYYCNWNCIFKTGENDTFPCVNSISVENVLRAVQQRLTII